MRRLATSLGIALVATLLALPAAVEAVGTESPTVTSPAPGQKLYSGFTGPFIVDLSASPKAIYAYWVDKTSGSTAPAGSRSFDFSAGGFDHPELTVPAPAPGSGYVFHIVSNDDAAIKATYAFSVSSDPAPRCSILLPGQVRMAARSYLIRATLSAQCKTLHTTYASWQARDPKNFFAETFTFDGVRTDSWRIYDDERTGLYKIRPGTARNSSNNDVPQNSTELTMRMDSRVSLTSSRSGAFVTLRTKSTRYSPVANKFVLWNKRKVVLSYRNCATCSWHRLKVRTSDRHGTTSYRLRKSAVRQYRATAAGTTTIWAPRPDYVRR